MSSDRYASVKLVKPLPNKSAPIDSSLSSLNNTAGDAETPAIDSDPHESVTYVEDFEDSEPACVPPMPDSDEHVKRVLISVIEQPVIDQVRQLKLRAQRERQLFEASIKEYCLRLRFNYSDVNEY